MLDWKAARTGAATVSRKKASAVAKFAEDQRRREERFCVQQGISSTAYQRFVRGKIRERKTVNRWCFFQKSEVGRKKFALSGQGVSWSFGH